MVTLNSTIRSVNAAANRVKRENQRQNRIAAQRFREQQKIQAIMDAENAVLNWNDYVEIIQSIHKNCSESIDWLELSKESKPIVPEFSNTNEKRAKSKLESYKPSFFDKLFRLTNKRYSKLEGFVVDAKNQDQNEYQKRYDKYLEDLQEWENLQSISKGVLEGQSESYLKAIEHFQSFSDITDLGTRVSVYVENNLFDIELHVNGNDIIPTYVLTQTSTGKLSKKNMPKTRFFELYQDHICSAVLRIARELFALLPIIQVRISAISKILNTQTGILEDKPILSVLFIRDTMDAINFNSIDPSDCMKNFIHEMKFKKTSGFDVVAKVEGLI